MVVALGATRSCRQPYAPEVPYAIGLVNGNVFVRLGPPFLRGLEKTVVTRCHLLHGSSFRDKVAGKVLHNELVVGKVLVECPDNIVAIGRNLHEVVAMIPCGIRETYKVQPMDRHTFAIARITEKLGNQALVGFLGSILEKGIDFLG